MKTLDLTSFFTTKAQAKDFSSRLVNLSGKLYELDKDLEKVLQEHLGVQKKDKFLTLLRDNEVPLDSNQALTIFIDNVTNQISQMSEVTITIAIEPDEQLLKSLSDWFLLNLESQVLLNTNVDTNIIAGATIDYEGNHLDNSIRAELQTMYSETKKGKEKTNNPPSANKQEHKKYVVEVKEEN